MDDFLSYRNLLLFCVLLGGAPFLPKPHLVEKIQMLMAGTLSKPIDIFDLFFHASPFLLLGYKLLKDYVFKTAVG